MNLKQAIALAARYTEKKDEGPEQCLRLLPGPAPTVAATNGVAGVVIACPDVGALPEPVAVHGAALKKMLDALGGDAKLTLGKGRKLTLTSGGSTLQIQAVPETRAPTTPEPPTTGWLALDGAQLGALASCAVVVDEAIKGNPALAGLFLGPTWASGASATSMAVAWVPTFATPVVVPPSLFAGVDRVDGQLADVGAACWLRQGDRAQWTRKLDTAWPADAVASVLANVRGSATRVISGVSVPALAAMARQAQAACESRAEPFRLVIEGDAVRLVGGDATGRYGARDFDGTIPGKANAPQRAVANVSPYALRDLAEVIAQACTDGYVSIGGATDPVMLWGGNPAVETMMLPLMGNLP